MATIIPGANLPPQGSSLWNRIFWWMNPTPTPQVAAQLAAMQMALEQIKATNNLAKAQAIATGATNLTQ